jgi:hypothetical protein
VPPEQFPIEKVVAFAGSRRDGVSQLGVIFLPFAQRVYGKSASIPFATSSAAVTSVSSGGW